MGFALDKSESIQSDVRRVICECVDEAIRSLHGERRAAAEAIHTARKRLKEVRAVLRLVRDEIGESVYQRENQAYRDAARPLSDLRDADVVARAFERIVRQDRHPAHAVDGVRKALRVRRAAIRSRVLRLEAAIDRVVRELAAARKRVPELTVASAAWQAFQSGLKRTYRRGRDAMAAAGRQASDEELHEWRKRVKDLRYQLEFLHKVWPRVLEAMADEAHELGDLLGDDHDLAVLCQLLEGELRPGIAPTGRKRLLGTIRRCRRSLQTEAEKLGRRVCAVSPRDFIDEMKAYWDAWR